MSKAQQERERWAPLTTGVRGLRELALLRHEGKTWQEIASLWGMRPIAGKDDLWHDIGRMWKRAGSPGGPLPVLLSRSDPARPRAVMDWRESRRAAIEVWLALLLDGVTTAMCPTCHGTGRVAVMPPSGEDGDGG